VYNTVKEAMRDHDIGASVIFVPASAAGDAIMEEANAGIETIVCITEHIPVHDMLYIKQQLKGSKSTLIGPNCPGVLTPGHALLGIIPARLATPGDTAIVSRSGTLTYEAMDLLTRAGLGQKYIVGIGGDMVRGSDFTEVLAQFQADPDVKRIVMIGEIGGVDEIAAADYIEAHVTKPVYAYIAGHSAPAGVQMGHAGAILGTNELESAATKTRWPLGSKSVVLSTLLRVGENFVGRSCFFEFVFSLLVSWVFIRVKLHRKLAISFFNCILI
jgi:succinyl-CoA synthetase alpha subunit